MEQVVEVNGSEIASESTSEDEIEGSYTSCPLKERIITVVHHFDAQSFVPIPNTPFNVEVELFGFNKDKDFQFDDNGKKTIDIVKEFGEEALGKELTITIEHKISRSDFDALYASYDGQLADLSAWLEGQSAIRKKDWADFLDNPPSLSSELEDLMMEIINAFREAWKELKKLFHMLSHPSEFIAKLQKYIEDPSLIEAIIDEGKQKAHDMLVLINDEVRVFILLNALYTWFCMLTPKQLNEALIGSLANIFVEAILRFVLPGGMILKTLKKLEQSL